MLEASGGTWSPAATEGAHSVVVEGRNRDRRTAPGRELHVLPGGASGTGTPPATERDRHARVPRYHTIGIGAGPANLSIAALYEAVAPHQIALFEGSPGPSWHNGMLHSGVRMQTSWIKDLVSLVDPQHRLSFLKYMVSTGRIYAFLNAQYDTIPRVEYVRYLAWASEQIERIHYGTRIDRIAFDEGFAVYSGDQLLARSEHLVLGIGTRAQLPTPFAGLDPSRAVVADRLHDRLDTMRRHPNRRIAVVGGGQTGAECVLELVRQGMRDVWWFGRRPWFAPLDDSPSANDFYRPAYTRFFPQLPAEHRRRLIEQQVLSSDGVSNETLRMIYQLNYEATLYGERSPVTMLPGRDVVQASAHGDGISLTCVEQSGEEVYEAGHVVIAAGRELAPLPLDPELAGLIDVDDTGDPIVEADFSLRWRGPDGHRIYAQNRAKYSHGLADKNLSLLAVRSAIIINSLFGREVYQVRDDFVTTIWSGARELWSDDGYDPGLAAGECERLRAMGAASA